LHHAPDLDHSLTTERDSAQANFVSVSYVIRATSREQIVQLATALREADDVVMLI
jgi:putative lipoic acid-binding regulatory protein